MKIGKYSLVRSCMLLFLVLAASSNALAAVTTAQIADGAVTTPKIANGAVTAAKLGIPCPNGYYLQYSIPNGWVCSVGTPGPIGPQGAPGATGPQGAQGPPGPRASYAGVAVVARSGGDYADPVSAMNAVATWCGTPSAANPCLLKIMPGVYDVGAQDVFMRDYVDIEGSGQATTKITGANAMIGSTIHATVQMASHAELRQLTVENRGADGYVVGVYAGGPTEWRITDATISSSGGVENQTLWGAGGFVRNTTIRAAGASNANYGVVCGGPMRHVRIEVSGAAVWNIGMLAQGPECAQMESSSIAVDGSGTYAYGVDGLVGGSFSSVTFTVQGAASNNGIRMMEPCLDCPLQPTIVRNSTFSVGGGTGVALVPRWGNPNPTLSAQVLSSRISAATGVSNGAQMQVIDTVIEASGAAVTSSGTLKVANSKLAGPVVKYGGTMKCFNSFDDAYDPVVCQ